MKIYLNFEIKITIILIKIYKLAIKCFKIAIELDKEDYEFYNSLGKMYRYKKDYKKAIEQYQKSLNINSTESNSESLYCIGLSYQVIYKIKYNSCHLKLH